MNSAGLTASPKALLGTAVQKATAPGWHSESSVALSTKLADCSRCWCPASSTSPDKNFCVFAERVVQGHVCSSGNVALRLSRARDAALPIAATEGKNLLLMAAASPRDAPTEDR